MKPTVYIPLADLRRTVVRRTSASSGAPSGAARTATRRLWTITDGRRVGMNDPANQSAGGSGQKRGT